MWAGTGSTSSVEQSAVNYISWPGALCIASTPLVAQQGFFFFFFSLSCPPFLIKVIYELTQGERQLIDDLSLVKKVPVSQL